MGSDPQTRKRKRAEVELIQYELKIEYMEFREKFKTIAVDNGSEFLDWRGLERSCVNEGGLPRNTYIIIIPYPCMGKRE